MKDIIERLLGGTTFPDSSCMPDAATEITTLRAKVKELTQDVLVRNNLMSQDHKLVVSLREQLAAMTQEKDNWKQKALGNIKWNQYSCPFVEVCHRVD